MCSARKPAITGVCVWVVVCAVLNAAGWLLSAAGQLNDFGYGVVATLCAVTGAWWWRAAKPRFSLGFRKRRYRKLFPMAFAILAVLALAGGLLHAPSNYDALAYRTPRVLHWLAEGQWHWIHTDFQRLNTRGNAIEWITAPLVLLTGTDRLFFLINAASFLLLPGLFFSVLVGLGVRRRVAWYWMWILPSGYCYLLQAGSIANDLFGATLAMAAIDFALRASREHSVRLAWLAILAAALMTSGKGFNLLLLLPWGLALLPALKLLLRRPVATFAVGTFALLISLVPTAILNHRHCGDWKGLTAEPVSLSTGDPALHLGVNGALLALHNLNPTFNPLAGAWNRLMIASIPGDWAQELGSHFESSGAQFQLGEIQMEETSGLGMGVSLLLLPVLFGGILIRRRTQMEWYGPEILVPVAAWLVILYFLSQSGLACPARYLAPFYALLLAPILRLPRAADLLCKAWWRGLAVVSFVAAALLLVASPARPLWPAKTLLKAWKADQSSSPVFQRIWAVYSVYGARADGFAPVRAILPPDLKSLGLVTFDDPETSLWRPFGARRIVHITAGDDARSLRQKAISHVLVSDYILTGHLKTTLPAWLDRFDAETITSINLSLRATRGPTVWHLVRLREASEND